jgi:hypothetical protein
MCSVTLVHALSACHRSEIAVGPGCNGVWNFCFRCVYLTFFFIFWMVTVYPNAQNVTATQQTFAVFCEICLPCSTLTPTFSHLSRSCPVLEYANIHVFYCPKMHGAMYKEYLSQKRVRSNGPNIRSQNPSHCHYSS